MFSNVRSKKIFIVQIYEKTQTEINFVGFHKIDDMLIQLMKQLKKVNKIELKLLQFVDMVRLQKIAYEQIVNSQVLGRARKLTVPRKWYTTNPNEHAKRLSYDIFHKSFVGRLLAPFYRMWFDFERKFQRSNMLQQGLTFEDKFLHHDAQLRRCVLWEHMARESLHPYHWVLKMRRKQRYYKVERGIRGFFVPQYIRNETKSQTYSDMVRLRDQWAEFTHNNYWSDMTPSARRTVIPVLSPFDLAMNYGILRNDAWSRYFFNEWDNGWYTEKQLKIVRDKKKFPYDLTTVEGKKQFQAEINSVNDKCPGLVAPQGQKFDFKKYYAEIGV